MNLITDTKDTQQWLIKLLRKFDRKQQWFNRKWFRRISIFYLMKGLVYDKALKFLGQQGSSFEVN